jgi:hypothetical protein
MINSLRGHATPGATAPGAAVGLPALWFGRLLRRLRFSMAAACLPAFMLFASPSAHAVDGCKLLLCISGNWRAIPMCVPTVVQALKDLAWHPWPTCDMSGPGNSGNFSWANEITCPPFYSNYNPENGAWQSCSYPALIHVTVNGAWWADVFADLSGNTSTHYSDTAKSSLSTVPNGIDPKYDNDAAAWTPPPPPPVDAGGGG